MSDVSFVLSARKRKALNIAYTVSCFTYRDQHCGKRADHRVHGFWPLLRHPPPDEEPTDLHRAPGQAAHRRHLGSGSHPGHPSAGGPKGERGSLLFTACWLSSWLGNLHTQFTLISILAVSWLGNYTCNLHLSPCWLFSWLGNLHRQFTVISMLAVLMVIGTLHRQFTLISLMDVK